MRKIIFIILIFTILSNCQNNNNNKKQQKFDKLFITDSIDENRMYGTWIGQDILFIIKKDTIFYPDRNESYRHTIKEDSVFTDFNGFIFKAKYIINKDTMIEYSEDTSIYIRIKHL